MPNHNLRKLIHDMNSELGSLEQALMLLNEKENKNPEFVNKMLPLSKEKVLSVMKIWQDIKSYIRDHK